MKTCARLRGDSRYALTRALLLYENGEGNAFATVNPVRQDGPAAEVAGGRPLCCEALADMGRMLSGQERRRQIIPAHILLADGARTLWHRPAGRRPLFVSSGRPALDAVNGKEVLWPALLFMAMPRTLYVWALAGDERPTEETPIYQAPFPNIYDDGKMCTGTARLPLETALDISAFERGFFETCFTHSNASRDLTRHPGGLSGLWQAMVAPSRRKFPREWLVPIRAGARQTGPVLTVGQLLAREIRA